MYNDLKVRSMVLPQELKDQRRWCNWRNVERDGRMTKMPMDANIEYPVGAKSNDEETWAEFETALERADSGTGMGYFFKEPYIGIDIDDVEEEINRHLAGDTEDNIVSELIFKFDSYTEISPSGKGIHIIIKGEMPETGRRKGNIEMYSGRRFFTVTFNSIGNRQITDHSDTGILEEVHEKYIKPKREEPIKVSSAAVEKSGEVGNSLSAQQVIDRILSSKHGENFKKLFEGDTSNYAYEDNDGRSEADLAFMNILAFWTAKDRDKMDTIYRLSGLNRDKWDEIRGHDTYGNIVIDKAIMGTVDVFNPRVTKAKTYQPDNNRTKAKDDWKMNQDEPTLEDSLSFPIRSADDTGNAERLVDRYGDIMRYDFNRDKFYVYNGQVWEIDNMGQARRLVNYTVETIEDEDWLADQGEAFTEEEEKAQEKVKESKVKHITRSRSRAAKTNMLELAQTYIPTNDDEFDQIDHHFNTENGYVDLRTGEFKDSDKEQMFSMMADVKMDDSAKPLRWLKFLDEVFGGDQELIDFIQRAVGYTLTGSTYEQSMFILLGDGRNGKSVFVETIRDIIGTYTKNIQASSLAMKPDNAPTNDLAKLKGVRMVTSSEPNDGFRFDEGLIKQITGDEIISARFLFKEEFDFVPNFKLWLTTNYKPIIKGTDDGIWRRLLIIPFDVKIAEEDVDKGLKDKLLAERSGILNWAIEGAVEWYKHEDLRVPEVVSKEAHEYRKQMSVIDQFIEDECRVGEDLEERASMLWDRYKMWSDDSRYNSLNKNEFGQNLVKQFERKRKSSGQHYIGLKLK